MSVTENRKRHRMLRAALAILLVTGVLQLWVAAGLEERVKNVHYSIVLGFLVTASLASTGACLWGDYFASDGSMQKGLITAVLMAIVCTGQLAAGSATFMYETIEYDAEALVQAENAYHSAQDALQMDQTSVTPGAMVTQITLQRQDGAELILFAPYEGADRGRVFQFTTSEGILFVTVSTELLRKRALQTAISAFSTAAVVSIIAAEMVLFATLVIERHQEQEREQINFPWLRQVAFLYFTAAKLCASFLPALGLRLAQDMLNPELIASLVATGELLCTSLGLLLSRRILENRGWRPGLCLAFLLTALGTALVIPATTSARGYAIYFTARCVGGLGYGFAWMTLRNIAQLQKKPPAAMVRLSSGIYAGMNFGVGLGALLVDRFTENFVLLLAALVGLATIIPLRGLDNATPAKARNVKPHRSFTGLLSLTAFALLVVLPTGILASFTSYYIPLYVPAVGGSVADVGAIQLAYGICIAYLGPAISGYAQKRAASHTQVVFYLAILGGTLLLFGFTGGLIAGLIAVLAFAAAESFGPVAQNNCFFQNRYISRQKNTAKAMTAFSLGKKMAESFGPLVFGLMAASGHITILGSVVLAAALAFTLVSHIERSSYANPDHSRAT